MLNIDLKKFQFLHKKKKNKIIFFSIVTNGKKKKLNLFDNFLIDKNSFVFESVEKGTIKGRYTIFGKNPDKIWEFNNNNCYKYNDKKNKIKINGRPKKIIEKIIINILTS